MKILISGISGYVGSFLANYLSKKGFEVHGITRSKTNIDYLDKNIKIYHTDLLDIEDLKIDFNYDIFIHLAGANDIDSKDEQKAFMDTTLSTKRVLNFCKNNDIKRLIYFSTFQVYGKDNGSIKNDTKINCKNDYSITHYFAEQYIENFSKNNKLDFIIVRPTNIYGASISNKIKRETLVPTCFCKDSLKESKIVLLSSGKQYRNFISLKEVSKYTKKVIENFDIYNKQKLIFASNINLQIIEIANITKKVYEKIFNKKCSIEVLNKEPKKSKHLKIDISSLPKLKFSKKNIEKEITKIFKIMRKNEIT